MNEPDVVLAPGTRVRTHETLGAPVGMMIRPDYLMRRAICALGTIRGIVGGHGGDIYWVEHDDGGQSAYGWWEFEIEVSP